MAAVGAARLAQTAAPAGRGVAQEPPETDSQAVPPAFNRKPVAQVYSHFLASVQAETTEFATLTVKLVPSPAHKAASSGTEPAHWKAEEDTQ
ncbi:hypothetical protein J4479_05910, partial [Candidatus Woesearchaeota archaeon]|nr:hypothetical protein [Candidatus Woesearchaeota archaeon]